MAFLRAIINVNSDIIDCKQFNILFTSIQKLCNGI